MAHVGIEGLGPRDGQKDAAQDHEAQEAVVEQELDAVVGRQGSQHADVVEDMIQTQRPQTQEPDGGDRAEILGQAGRAARLDQEQGDQDAGRDRHDEGIQPPGQTRRVLQAFDGGQDRDGRRNDAVAIEQGRAADAEDEDPGAAPTDRELGQCHQRQGAALALVVGAHQEEDVFERHHHHQRPKRQRHDADHGQIAADAGARMVDRLAQGVKRTGADVAEHHADGADGQGPKAAVLSGLAARDVGFRTRGVGGLVRRVRRGRGSARVVGSVPGHAYPPGLRRGVGPFKAASL